MAQVAIFKDASGNTLDASGNKLHLGTLNADNDEASDWATVNITMPSGYVSTGSWELDATGTSDAKYQLAPPDASGNVDEGNAAAYGAALAGSDTIDDTTGLDVFVRAKATSGESATPLDATVTLSFAGECQTT